MLALEILGAWFVLAAIGAFVAEDQWMHRFALATDVFFAAILLNRKDVTISSWSGISTYRVAGWLAWVLCKIQANHTEIARQSDIQHAQEAIRYLQTKDGTCSPS